MPTADQAVQRCWFSAVPGETIEPQPPSFSGYLLRIIRQGSRTCPRIVGGLVEVPRETRAVVQSYVRSATFHPDESDEGKERVLVVSAADGVETTEEWRLFEKEGVPHLCISCPSSSAGETRVLVASRPPHGLLVGGVTGAAVSTVPDVPVNPVEWTCLVQPTPLSVPACGSEEELRSERPASDAAIVIAVGHFSSDDVPNRPVLMYRVEPVPTGSDEEPRGLLLHKVYELLPSTAGVVVVYDKPKRVGSSQNVTGKWMNISAAVSGWFVGTLTLASETAAEAGGESWSCGGRSSVCAACGAAASDGALRCVEGLGDAQPVCLDCWGMTCCDDTRALESLRWFLVA